MIKYQLVQGAQQLSFVFNVFTFREEKSTFFEFCTKESNEILKFRAENLLHLECFCTNVSNLCLSIEY